jgi:hypothetical protein
VGWLVVRGVRRSGLVGSGTRDGERRLGGE